MKSSFVEEECPGGNAIRAPELGGSSGAARVRKRAPGAKLERAKWRTREIIVVRDVRGKKGALFAPVSVYRCLLINADCDSV